MWLSHDVGEPQKKEILDMLSPIFYSMIRFIFISITIVFILC